MYQKEGKSPPRTGLNLKITLTENLKDTIEGIY